MKSNREFVHGLLETHKIQEELRRIQYTPDKREARESLSAELEMRLAETPRLKRLLDAGDLVGLLAGMTPTDMSMFPYYLHLARVTTRQL